MYKRILVTLDGSELSEAVLPHVREMCQGTDTHITLLRVADLRRMEKERGTETDLMPGGYVDRRDAGVATRETVDQQLQRVEDEIQLYLEDRSRRLRGVGGGVQTEILFADKVAESIVEYAKGADVDAIMMSTHGRGGLASVFMGSIASKVIRESNLPVLVVCPRPDARDERDRSERS